MNPSDTDSVAVCESAARGAWRRGLSHADRGEHQAALNAFGRAEAWAHRARVLVLKSHRVGNGRAA